MTETKHRILKCASLKQIQHSVAFERFGVTRHICHRNLSYVSSIRSYCLFFCMQVKCGRSILKLVVLFAHGIAEKCHLSLRDLTEMNVFLLL